MPSGLEAGTAQNLFINRFRDVQESIDRLRLYWSEDDVTATEGSNRDLSVASTRGWLLWLSLVGVPVLVPQLAWHAELRQFAVRFFCNHYVLPFLRRIAARTSAGSLEPVKVTRVNDDEDALWTTAFLSTIDGLATGQVHAPQCEEKRSKVRLKSTNDLQCADVMVPWPLAECVVLYQLVFQRLASLVSQDMEKDIAAHPRKNGNMNRLDSHFDAGGDNMTRSKSLESLTNIAEKQRSRWSQQTCPPKSVIDAPADHRQIDAADEAPNPRQPCQGALASGALWSACQPSSQPEAAIVGVAFQKGERGSEERSSASQLFTTPGSAAIDGAAEIEQPKSPSPYPISNSERDAQGAMTDADALEHSIGLLVWKLITGVESCLPEYRGISENPQLTIGAHMRHRDSRIQLDQSGQVFETPATGANESTRQRQWMPDRHERKRAAEWIHKSLTKRASFHTDQGSNEASIRNPDRWRFASRQRSPYARIAAVLALFSLLRDSNKTLFECALRRSTFETTSHLLKQLFETWRQENNTAGMVALSSSSSMMLNTTFAAACPLKGRDLMSILIAILRGAVHEFGQYLLSFSKFQGTTPITSSTTTPGRELRTLQQHLEQMLCEAMRSREDRDLRRDWLPERLGADEIVGVTDSSVVAMLQEAVVGVQVVQAQLEADEGKSLPMRHESGQTMRTSIPVAAYAAHSAELPKNGLAEEMDSSPTLPPAVTSKASLPLTQRIASFLLQVAERRGVDAFLAAFDRFAAKTQSPWLETLEVLLSPQPLGGTSVWSRATRYRALFELDRQMNVTERFEGRCLLKSFWRGCEPCPGLEEQCDPVVLLTVIRTYLNRFASETLAPPAVGTAPDIANGHQRPPDLQGITNALVDRLVQVSDQADPALSIERWSVADSLFTNVLTPSLQPPTLWSATALAMEAEAETLNTVRGMGPAQSWLAAIEELALWIPLSAIARSLQTHLGKVLAGVSTQSTGRETPAWLLAVLRALDRGLTAQYALHCSDASPIEAEPQQCSLFDELFLTQLGCGCEPVLPRGSPPATMTTNFPAHGTAPQNTVEDCCRFRELLCTLAENLLPFASAGVPILSSRRSTSTNQPNSVWEGWPARNELPMLYIEVRPLRQRLVWLCLRALCTWKPTSKNRIFLDRCLKTLAALYADPADEGKILYRSTNAEDTAYVSPRKVLRLFDDAARSWSTRDVPLAADIRALSALCSTAYALWLHDEQGLSDLSPSSRRINLTRRLWRWELQTFQCEQNQRLQFQSSADLERCLLWRAYLRHLLADGGQLSLTACVDGVVGARLCDALAGECQSPAYLAPLPACLLGDMIRSGSVQREREALRELFWQHLYTALMASGSLSQQGPPSDLSCCESVLATYMMLLGILEPDFLPIREEGTVDEQHPLAHCAWYAKTLPLLDSLPNDQQRTIRSMDISLALQCARITEG